MFSCTWADLTREAPLGHQLRIELGREARKTKSVRLIQLRLLTACPIGLAYAAKQNTFQPVWVRKPYHSCPELIAGNEVVT